MKQQYKVGLFFLFIGIFFAFPHYSHGCCSNRLPGSPVCPDSIYKCNDCLTAKPAIKVAGNVPMACGIINPGAFNPNDPTNQYCYEHVLNKGKSFAGVEETWCWLNQTIPTNTPFPTPLPIDIYCTADPANGISATDINTQIGCIPANNPNDTATWFFRRIFAIVSAIAFFVMIAGGVEIATSTGNPDKVKHGRENIVAAISGLIFILLAIFLLRLIGVDIIKIPGFAKP